jgi:hypothetical protein
MRIGTAQSKGRPRGVALHTRTSGFRVHQASSTATTEATPTINATVATDISNVFVVGFMGVPSLLNQQLSHQQVPVEALCSSTSAT